ncbi:MAG: NAD(+)/NADH kinase, partial [Firmicutes bacterium]|nr:NAD(+)/NADH kinase [Bacillota bacterium]
QSVWMAAGLPSEAFSVAEDHQERPELCLVLGGDGTLLAAARRYGHLGVPLLGINLGSLGFLTAHGVEEAQDVVELYFQNRLRRELRHALDVSLVREGRVLTRHSALNDAVLNKGALARIIEFQLRIDGFDAASIRADGLIVATPTGSTAYSLSAGGPILHPALDAWVVSPICPHSLTLRPMVVPSDLEMSITVGATDEAHLTLDGQIEYPLQPGDRVELSRSSQHITLLQNPALPFFRVLQQKLHWNTR